MLDVVALIDKIMNLQPVLNEENAPPAMFILLINAYFWACFHFRCGTSVLLSFRPLAVSSQAVLSPLRFVPFMFRPHTRYRFIYELLYITFLRTIHTEDIFIFVSTLITHNFVIMPLL
jgi:hypothetical protein